MVTEQNYLRVLQQTEAALNQVFRFLQFSKRPSARILLKVRSDIRSIIVEELKQNRRKQLEQLREQQQKKDVERQQKLNEQFLKRLRQSDD